MSMRYDVAEDRIKLVSRGNSESVPTLWLTQRLLSRLMVPIFEWLEAVASPVDGPEDQLSQARQQHAALHQPATRPQAVNPPANPNASARPDAPDSPDAGGDFLVREINVRRNESGIMLSFQLSDQQVVRIPFSEDQLRRWLNALYRLWRQAEWRNEVWPDWMHQAMTQHPDRGSPDAVH